MLILNLHLFCLLVVEGVLVEMLHRRLGALEQLLEVLVVVVHSMVLLLPDLVRQEILRLAHHLKVIKAAIIQMLVVEPEQAAVELPELLNQGHSARADDEAQRNERNQQLAQAVAKLPGEQRRLIECAFLKGLTHHAISESLGLPLGTVKTNIRRGLIKLRESLKGGSVAV